MTATPPDQDKAADPGLEEKEPVPQEVLDRALALVRKLVRGNGFKPEDIALESFEGEILNFEAYNVFKIKAKTAEKTVPGKDAGEVVGSLQDARTKIQAAVQTASADPDARTQAKELLAKREDLGFAATDLSLRLDRHKRKIVVHVVCSTCSGNARLPCATCQGNKRVKCTRCHGQREIVCHRCNGSQYISQGNDRVQCPECFGRGRTPCQFCRQTGAIACLACKAEGQTACQTCTGTGWVSYVHFLELDVKNAFDYKRELLPEKVPPLIDALAGEMVTDAHAEVRLIDDREKEQELDKNSKPDEMLVPYDVRLPWGDIKFAFGPGELVSGNLFGFQPALVHMGPFLEIFAARGIRELAEAAAGGNSAGKLQEGARFRLVAETVLAVARFPRKRALELMNGRYPAGLRPETVKSLVDNADLALKNATRRSRAGGLLGGLAIAALLYGGYYIGPGRAALAPLIGAGPGMTIIDLLLVALGGMITTLSIQYAAVRALHDALGKLLPPEKKRKIVPKPGRSALWGCAAGLALYILMVELSYRQGAALPGWYDVLRGALPF